MPMDVRIVAQRSKVDMLVRQLARLSDALPQTIYDTLRSDVGPHLVKVARDGAFSHLPKRGGLAARTAQTEFQILPVTRSDGVGLIIRAAPTALKDPARMDRGRIRHPVFGRWTNRAGRDISVLQDVPRGWFTDSIRDTAPEVRKTLIKRLDSLIKQF